MESNLRRISVIPEISELESPLLGDVIICPQVLLEESVSLKKTITEHWALIVYR